MVTRSRGRASQALSGLAAALLSVGQLLLLLGRLSWQAAVTACAPALRSALLSLLASSDGRTHPLEPFSSSKLPCPGPPPR